jgi:hypothetical protein
MDFVQRRTPIKLEEDEAGKRGREKGIAPRKLEKGGRDVEKQLGNLSVKPCR